ncbi:hypothetical protein FNV43_RR15775 [Rhamnella rubrinervis]|uniref:CRM domain-containing protein n=1 Tax=Rhamnella rubrinervis TaxID=2594499 RepID=A0A8K0E2D5_9ROSA|nr:hypothetical protein FNV43_RR15775 [Rhamnella rubrinervis]
MNAKSSNSRRNICSASMARFWIQTEVSRSDDVVSLLPEMYPRLVKQVPEGLTLEEATEIRRKGRELIPISKLGMFSGTTNGVYIDLVENVREAFEECELVRINCQGMNGSDYHKIGAKLRDLVPCVLISFEREHILMWRGQNWKSSLPKLESDREEGTVSNVDNATSIAPPLKGQVVSASRVPTVSVNNASPEVPDTSKSHMDSEVMGAEESGSSMERVDPCFAVLRFH